MTVTNALRKALDGCGKTRYAVSKETGIPESTLSRFMAGQPPRGETLDRLCQYLNLTLKPGTPRKGE